MRYRPYGKKRKFDIILIIRILIFVAFNSFLIVSGFYTGSLIISSLTSQLTTTHPTSIPWIKDKTECEKTGRDWLEDKCWDNQHNPTF
jgi:hypothetical protein